MRVIGGTHRGRRLRVPSTSALRPTSDRVREAIFDVLSHLGGEDVIEGADFIDLFAGSGALGIEALSIGAATVTFVESDRDLARGITENLATLGYEHSGAAHVAAREALGFLLQSHRAYDVALVDPPYAFDEWPALLSRLKAKIVVLESNREVSLPEGTALHRHYRYGTTLVTVARKLGRPNVKASL